MAAWKPGASVRNLQLRAELLTRTRAFFAHRGVLEVETPLLSKSTVTDVNIESFQLTSAEGSSRYLQTSPEYAMKRLLAAGSGPIFQISKAFRQAERSRLHNPEFTLLEWYRPKFNWQQLMDEVAELMATLLNIHEIPRISYAEAFAEHLQVDPHDLQGKELEELARQHIDIAGEGLGDTDYLQLLMHHRIEPALPDCCFIYDYPKQQAALAEIGNDHEGREVARRFELYVAGMELANAYQELTDAAEQRRRFAEDIATRQAKGLPERQSDERLLAAMDHGLPSCSGVALGFDRLVMLAANSNSIGEVIAFDDDLA